MPSRLEIGLKKHLKDAAGLALVRKSKEYFRFEVADARLIRVLTIDASFSPAQLERVRTEIFTNPVIEASSYRPTATDFDWLIWVGLRPGVRDTAGSTAIEAIEDLLGTVSGSEEAVYTSKLYEIRGNLQTEQVRTIASETPGQRHHPAMEGVFARGTWDPRRRHRVSHSQSDSGSRTPGQYNFLSRSDEELKKSPMSEIWHFRKATFR